MDEIEGKTIGSKIVRYEELPSTNLRASMLIEEGAEEGTVVIAETQTEGRGRKDRGWSSPKGGLWFSVILYPDFPPEKTMMITMAASVSVVKGIKEIAGLACRTKWPNDVLIDNKKVSGILAEAEVNGDGRLRYMVIGIGMNVNNEIKGSLKDTATSLKMEYGDEIPKEKLLVSVLKHLEDSYQDVSDGDHERIKEEWLSLSDMLDREVMVRRGEEEIKGFIKGVNEYGHLMLGTEEGTLSITTGDITYI